MLVPLNVDVPMDRWPWANWAVIGVTVLMSAALFGAGDDSSLPDLMVLSRYDFHPVQLVGHLYAHGGILHLLGNMVFLFCFGNAVNAKLGHLWYLALYHALGVLAGLGWLMLSHGVGLVGASGAIMGVVGAFVVFFPKNDVKLFYWFGWFWRGTVDLSAYWVIGMYVVFDLWGLAMSGKGDGVAYIAHVVGAAAGAGAAVGLIKLGFGQPNEYEQNLLQVLADRRETPISTRMPADRPANVAPRGSASVTLRTTSASASAPPRRPASGAAERRQSTGMPPIPMTSIPLAGPFAADESSNGPSAPPLKPAVQGRGSSTPANRGRAPRGPVEEAGYAPAEPPSPYDVR